MGGGSNSNLGVQILNSKIMVYTYDMQKTGFAIAPCKPASTAPDLKINNLCAKGQLISKCLFGVFNSPKKPTKTIRLEVP